MSSKNADIANVNNPDQSQYHTFSTWW